ncbi:two-component system sensor histidine kinase NtrB [Cohnella hongkongensis]|uniref:histidine kinase n=1 Tax=Cohnella hongkongensis TaxID=178337 RepID=A0ABV9FK44_9BACL
MMDEPADLAGSGSVAGKVERERYLRQFVNRLLSMEEIGVLLLDSDFRIAEVSDMIVSLSGFPRANIVNKPAERWFEEVGLEPGPFDRSLLEGQTFRNRVLIWKRDKQVHRLMIDGENLVEGVERTGAFVLFRDVSHLMALEEQVRRSDRLKTIGQIAAGTAHEIRNPLTAIKGFMQLLNKSLADRNMEKEQEFVGIVLSELDRVNDLVSEFLLLSKPKELKQTWLKIGGVIQEILPMIRNEALLYNVTVIYDPMPELPPISADKELLKQVFLNLGKNAIEAMDGGGTLIIRERRSAEDSSRITVEFQDTGPGIPADVLEKVFDPFFTTKPQGTGLGLSVCQRIVDDLGGSIEVTSGGEGTLFVVGLPGS